MILETLENQNCIQKETVQWLPSGDHGTKKCAFVNILSMDYPISAGRKDKKQQDLRKKTPRRNSP